MFSWFSRKSPVEADGDGAVEAGSEQSNSRSTFYGPTPGYNLDPANAFSHSAQGQYSGYAPPPGYNLDPANPSCNSNPQSFMNNVQRQQSYPEDANRTAIDGIPFKYSANVILKDQIQIPDSLIAEQIISKVKAFNWDDYEYDFELEKSILKEISSLMKMSSQEDQAEQISEDPEVPEAQEELNSQEEQPEQIPDAPEVPEAQEDLSSQEDQPDRIPDAPEVPEAELIAI